MSTGTAIEIDQQWARVRGRLREEVGEAAYRSWLKPLTLAELDDGAVRISVPTRFMRDWVLTHFADRLRALWLIENKAVSAVEIFVASKAPTAHGAGARGAGSHGLGDQWHRNRWRDGHHGGRGRRTGDAAFGGPVSGR